MRAPQEIAKHRVRRKYSEIAKKRQSALQRRKPSGRKTSKRAPSLQATLSHLDGISLPSRFVRRLIGPR